MRTDCATHGFASRSIGLSDAASELLRGVRILAKWKALSAVETGTRFVAGCYLYTETLWDRVMMFLTVKNQTAISTYCRNDDDEMSVLGICWVFYRPDDVFTLYS
jgi:hypothetical protein